MVDKVSSSAAVNFQLSTVNSLYSIRSARIGSIVAARRLPGLYDARWTKISREVLFVAHGENRPEHDHHNRQWKPSGAISA